MENKDIETLLAKEAIRDQIYTYCRALDRIDNELGYSVFAEDSKVNYGPTFPKGTGRQFIDNNAEPASSHDIYPSYDDKYFD